MQIDYTSQKTLNNPVYIKGVVIENEQKGDQYHRLKVSLSKPIGLVVPGQFAMLSIEGEKNILLPRPFSIHNFDNEENVSQLVFLIKVVGEGSRLLARLSVGSPLRVLAPLGVGFRLPPPGYKVLIVAGGMGIAPLFPLILGLGRSHINLHLFYGAKSQRDLISLHELLLLKGISLSIATEDGTHGEFGLITKLLKDKVPFGEQKMVIYTCGPESMIQSVASLAAERMITCWASLERRMACGMGACLGCVVKTKKGYLCSCTNGPVFNTQDIIWPGDAKS
jgi:dihydroorotate dehydrogenase electron transfer subunit